MVEDDSESPTLAAGETGGAEHADEGADDSGAPTPPIDRTVDRYVLVDLLGKGGMGLVYRAFDPQLDRFVALKLVAPRREHTSSGPTPAERLLQEARLMARLSHPNLVKVHDVGLHEHRVYLAMELVEGTTLRNWLRRAPRVWPEILAVFVGAGRGLAAAHSIGLVHRDFKPDNVLVTAQDHAFVADFGLARLVDAAGDSEHSLSSTLDPSVETSVARPRTRDGVIVGTPAYMAPEQHLGRSVDARADQFAFCVALYEALFGVRPFTGHSVDALVSNMMRGELSAPRLRRSTPRWLRKAVLRGLERDASRRHVSMDALLDALEEPPRRRRVRRRVALALAPVGVGAFAAWVWQASAPERLCPPDPVDRVGFDATRKQALVSGFSAAGAADLVAPLLHRIERETVELAQVRGDTCREVQVHRTKSTAWRADVDACLDRHAQRLGMLVDELAHPDAGVALHAVEALDRLGGASRCQHPDPGITPRSSVERTLARRLDRASVQLWLGLTDTLAAEEAALLEEARAVGTRTLIAELSLIVAERYERDGDDAARRWFYEAIWNADAGHADRLGAVAWTRLLTWMAAAPARRERANEIATTAEHAVRRAGEDVELAAALALARARLALAGAGHDRALELLEPFVAREPALASPVAAEVAGVRARALLAAGRPHDALAPALHALALTEENAGANHPALAPLLELTADVLSASGYAHESSGHRERAQRVRAGAAG